MKSVICCSHAGGQGKTTVAQLAYLALKRQSMTGGIVSADFIDESGHSKIGRLYPTVVRELGPGPDVGLVKERNDVNANLKYWDSFGSLLVRGGNVFDIGANVIDQILDWGDTRRAPVVLQKRGAPPIDVALVCRAEQRAIDDLGDLIRRFGSMTSLPVNSLTVFLNEMSGDFSKVDVKSALERVSTSIPLSFVRMPRCTSELWLSMEANYVSLETALSMQPEDAVEKLGIDMWSAHSGVEDLRLWFEEMIGALREARFC